MMCYQQFMQEDVLVDWMGWGEGSVIREGVLRDEISSFWVPGWTAVPPAEIRNTEAEIMELSWWEEDGFD